MARKLLLALFALALSPASIRAAAPPRILQAFTLRAATRAVSSNKLTFAWPAVGSIDALMRFDAVQAAKVSVYLTVRSPGGDVLAKKKQKLTLAAGRQELRLPDIFATTDVMGTRELTARLELSVKGRDAETSEVDFEVTGPPAPSVSIEDLRVYSPADDVSGTEPPKTRAQFDPGAPFIFDVVFNLAKNPAQLHPRLVMLASMDDDAQATGFDLPRQEYKDHWDFKPLDESEGRFRATGRGAMPYFFASPWSSHHPLKLYAVIDFGGAARTVSSVACEVFDYHAGEARRSDDVRTRLVTLARADSWVVSAPDAPAGQPTPYEMKKYRAPGR